MKKNPVILMIFLVLLAAASASADSEVTAVPGITYMCGDSFEVTIQDQPITASQFSRASHALAEAGIGERLVEIRLIFRNLTPTVYNGFTPDSFSLTQRHLRFLRGRTDHAAAPAGGYPAGVPGQPDPHQLGTAF